MHASSGLPTLQRPVLQVSDDIEDAQERAEGLVEQAIESLPRVGIAVAIVLVSWLLSRLVRFLLRRRFERSRPPSFAQVVPKLFGWLVLAVGVLLAVTIAFPGVDPVDVIAGLGIVSVAAGFAFQDILSNLLSGLLLIMRQPFVSGDQIEVNDIQGTVEGITIRETAVTTFDGRLVLIPNKDVYQNAISIQTAHDSVRTSLVVGCSYDDDLELAAETALTALGDADGVLDEPAPQAFFTEFGDSTINLDLRYWTSPQQVDIRRTQGNVVVAVKAAFDKAGLDIPWPIRTLEARTSLREAVQETSTAGRSNPSASASAR